jgi:hypothetical protein
MSEGFSGEGYGFSPIHAMDRAMGAVDCKPIQSERWRIRDTRFGELAKVWEAGYQADSSAIELLQRVLDSASAIIRANRVQREEPVALSAEADRLPVTLAEMDEDEPKRQGGSGADSRPVEGIGVVAGRRDHQGVACGPGLTS